MRLFYGLSFRRIYWIFRFLLTIFLVIKRRKHYLYISPLSPVQLKESILYLGASFIKLAQVLATRADFFPEAYLDELKELHDEIPPMSQKEFDLLWKRNFDSDTFKTFSPQPIASASIGQVHEAFLKTGERVAVKLRRLGIREQVQTDLKIIRFFYHFFKPLFSKYTKHSIESILVEFGRMILKETSMIQELHNLQSFAQEYAGMDVIFPSPHVAYCSDDVLVMSFEEGVRFDDREALSRLGIHFEEIIETLVNFYMEQMLIRGFFHADPHPGNLLVTPEGKLVLLDFGMVKTIGNTMRKAIIELVKAAHEEDFETYIHACKRMGIISEEAPMESMQEYARKMFAIFGDQNLDAINMQKLGFEVLESMKEMPFKLPQEAVYIMRVSSIIEGLGTTYIPNFNGVKDILPLLQKNLTRALVGEENLFDMLIREIRDIPITLTKSRRLLEVLENGELEVRVSPREKELLIYHLKSYFRPLLIGVGMVTSAFFLGVVLHENELATGVFAAGVLIIVYYY